MGLGELVLGWEQGLTLLAPAVAIVTALATRRVLAALAAGVAVAAVVAHRGTVIGSDGLRAVVDCFVGADTCAHDGRGALGGVAAYLGEAVLDVDNLTITLFTGFVAAMVGVMGVSGATERLVGAVERLASGPRGTMVASWLAGFVVFFDDYANCLVVGSSMGPVCDRNGVSRAKLAYIVDSTAAPVASMAIVGTWVGYEIGLLDQSLAAAGHGEGGGFELFLAGLPFRFYSLFAVALVGIIAFTGRDFGPMVEAERDARATLGTREPVVHPGGSLLLAAAPVVLLVVVTFGLMLWDGIRALEVPVAEAPLYEILGGADAYRAMFWGGAVGWLAASAAGLLGGSMDLGRWVSGSRGGLLAVAQAIGILYLAWTLGNAIADTSAQDFLLSMLGDWFPPWLLPAVVFSLASLVAFATGTSFGTMSILLPLAVPLAVTLAPDVLGIVAGTTSAVLAGACFGDHASPISDTTVLSAAGSQVDLVTHVRTQLPYTLLAGVVSIFVGYVPAGLGVSPWVSLVLGIGVMIGWMRLVGIDPAEPVSAR